jgi:hypothetical protein
VLPRPPGGGRCRSGSRSGGGADLLDGRLAHEVAPEAVAGPGDDQRACTECRGEQGERLGPRSVTARRRGPGRHRRGRRGLAGGSCRSLAAPESGGEAVDRGALDTAGGVDVPHRRGDDGVAEHLLDLLDGRALAIGAAVQNREGRRGVPQHVWGQRRQASSPGEPGERAGDLLAGHRPAPLTHEERSGPAGEVHADRGEPRAESACIHSAPGSLSTLNVPAGSKAPHAKLCQLDAMLCTAAA